MRASEVAQLNFAESADSTGACTLVPPLGPP